MTGLPNQRSRTFAQAAFSYDGAKDYEKVETFLTFARKYKSVKNIGDVDALRSLPLVLKGDAATWWNGIKDTITTWMEFETQLRKAFSPKKPAYVIYQEISELRQKPGELTERFVAKQRALFNQLPSPGLTEQVQLDIMYGFLLPKIQEEIPRECIRTFEGLLEAAREHEKQQLKTQAKPCSENRAGKKRVRCNFCRHFGHVADVCRKRQKIIADEAENPGTSSIEQSEIPATLVSSPSSPKPVIDEATPKNGDSIKVDIRPRLMIEISIGTAKELAFVDSCAKSSLASYKLYSYLKNIGFHFQEENTTVTLADGIAKSQIVYTGRIPVKVNGRCVLTTFLVLPEARDNSTLLGVGFIIDAGIVLNLPQLTYNFIDEPDVHYDLIEEES